MTTKYAQAVAQGLCPQCRNPNSPPMPGRTRCAPCAARGNAASAKYHKKHRATYNAYMRGYMQRRRLPLTTKEAAARRAALLARLDALQSTN